MVCDGVYALRDEDGAVVRIGRSKNLYERRQDHARDPPFDQFRFRVEYLTDDPDEQKGLEQMLYDRYPEPQEVNGGYNVYRTVDPANREYQKYRRAAESYLDSQAGG